MELRSADFVKLSRHCEGKRQVRGDPLAAGAAPCVWYLTTLPETLALRKSQPGRRLQTIVACESSDGAERNDEIVDLGTRGDESVLERTKGIDELQDLSL